MMWCFEISALLAAVGILLIGTALVHREWKPDPDPVLIDTELSNCIGFISEKVTKEEA